SFELIGELDGGAHIRSAELAGRNGPRASSLRLSGIAPSIRVRVCRGAPIIRLEFINGNRAALARRADPQSIVGVICRSGGVGFGLGRVGRTSPSFAAVERVAERRKGIGRARAA
ncbi:MAG: hypothetical protein J0H25_04015, partial [Rhizobiales bacterium]|nr:hypothetical protein [Hyphomicrobiales bacterium]